jgi:hypothetical protein
MESAGSDAHRRIPNHGECPMRPDTIRYGPMMKDAVIKIFRKYSTPLLYAIGAIPAIFLWIGTADATLSEFPSELAIERTGAASRSTSESVPRTGNDIPAADSGAGIHFDPHNIGMIQTAVCVTDGGGSGTRPAANPRTVAFMALGLVGMVGMQKREFRR